MYSKLLLSFVYSVTYLLCKAKDERISQNWLGVQRKRHVFTTRYWTTRYCTTQYWTTRYWLRCTSQNSQFKQQWKNDMARTQRSSMITTTILLLCLIRKAYQDAYIFFILFMAHSLCSLQWYWFSYIIISPAAFIQKDLKTIKANKPFYRQYLSLCLGKEQENKTWMASRCTAELLQSLLEGGIDVLLFTLHRLPQMLPWD